MTHVTIVSSVLVILLTASLPQQLSEYTETVRNIIAIICLLRPILFEFVNERQKKKRQEQSTRSKEMIHEVGADLYEYTIRVFAFNCTNDWDLSDLIAKSTLNKLKDSPVIFSNASELDNWLYQTAKNDCLASLKDPGNEQGDHTPNLSEERENRFRVEWMKAKVFAALRY